MSNGWTWLWFAVSATLVGYILILKDSPIAWLNLHFNGLF